MSKETSYLSFAPSNEGNWLIFIQLSKHRTMSASVSRLLGLTKKEVAPQSKARSMSTFRAEAVQTMIDKRLRNG